MMMSQEGIKAAHPIHIYMDQLLVRCGGCGWVSAITGVEDAKYKARMHWALMDGRDGR